MNKDTKILMVCSGNINRSPAAEYLFKQKGFANVDSCGLGKTAARSLPMTKRMKEAIGVEIDHTSKQITQEMVDWADVIFCMGPGQVRKVNKTFHTNKATMFGVGKIEDPHFTGRYQIVLEQINEELNSSTLYSF